MNFKSKDRVIAIINFIPNTVQTASGAKSLKRGYIDNIRAVDPDDGIRLETVINPINPVLKNEYNYCITGFKKLVSDEELLEYRKNVSMKENLQPELIPIKQLIES